MKRGLVIAAVALQLLVVGEARGDEEYVCHDFTGSHVLLVGDSQTYYSDCASAYPRWDSDGEGGRDSTEALDALGGLLRDRHTRVVFDIATNDWPNPEAFRDNLRTLWGELDGRGLTLVTTYIDWPELGNVAEPVNAEIRDFASAHPQRVEVVPWGQYARDHQELFRSDGVHYTAEGYVLRSAMVRAGVRELRAKCRRRCR